MEDNYILWIEDDRMFLDNTIPLLEKKGFSVEGVTNVKEGIKRLRKNYFKYSLVLLDLEMPEMDGVESYEEIKRVNSQLPIIIVSAHLGEPIWESRMKSLKVRLERIAKPFPMITSEDFEEIMKLIRQKQRHYIKTRINPFKYSYKEFMNLTDEERDQVFEIAAEINSGFTNEFFEKNKNKDWIVIAKTPGNIIESGKSKDEPDVDRLEKLAKKYDTPVFTYSRPKTVEQIGTNWPCKSNSDDYYPTVSIGFNSNGEQHILQGDFDTGSTHSFISYEVIMGMGVLERKPIIPASSKIIFGKRYRYYKIKLKCKLYGESKEKEIELKCELVKNWKDSPQVFHYKDRVALIGRNLLLDNKVKLLLDGENKKTDILI